jgi:hypothetical protein
MGKQLTLLRKIIDAYNQIDLDPVIYNIIKKNNSIFIKQMFNRSLNKKDLTRRILFDALLSDDDIVKLLRIIFDKEK